jgi:hypothetical protein
MMTPLFDTRSSLPGLGTDMLHRGKAHTYGLDGPFGIPYGASIVWFVTTLVVTLPAYAAGHGIALPCSIAGVGISWLLGLIAFVHRRAAWRWWGAETVVLLILAILCLS